MTGKRRALICARCRSIRVAGQRAVLPRKLRLVGEQRGGIKVECRVCGYQWVSRSAVARAMWAESNPNSPDSPRVIVKSNVRKF